jgi:phage terminase large subunit GpA-like protein
MSSDRVPEAIKAMARPLGYRKVPLGTRFIISTIDVQKSRFVVQVQGFGLNGDCYVIDRFDIKKSKRLDEDGEHQRIAPASHLEDWKILVEEVISKGYELSDGSGRMMMPKLVMCDSAGKAGSTENAYNFYRWLKVGDPENQKLQDEGTYEWTPALAGRFLLVKGEPLRSAPTVKISYPDSQRKDRTAGARGEVPVAFLNTNSLKDMVDNRLDKETAGARFHFPDWLDDNFYIELTVEVKDPAKGWINPKNYRNETFDLLYYALGGTLTPQINLRYMDLDKPPAWAEEWDKNVLVFDPAKKEKPFDAEKKKRHSLSKLARNLT